MTDWIVENKNIPDNLKTKYIELGKEIELEGIKRKLIGDNQLSFEDQIAADVILKK